MRKIARMAMLCLAVIAGSGAHAQAV